MPQNLSDPDLEPLRSVLEGDALAPGDDGWDAARQCWNLAADQNPALIVLAESTADVVATLGFAREHGLGVAPLGTGHGAAAFADLGGSVLLRTSRMTGVVDRRSEADRPVGAGAKVEPTSSARRRSTGSTGLHGSSGTVGVAGYMLRGGLGWLARSRGFACNSVARWMPSPPTGGSAGSTPSHEPDLFWALRGGGGTHAIVTSFEHGWSRCARRSEAR